ncbi:MAG: hypothetical protein GF344_16190 [Chitinivibrionales bacterium]|nr:hypothetical protein [Chitinivibrionales bacterium]MBD3358232.1 hypothetical protein [Chitinivibrionales bacterium]
MYEKPQYLTPDGFRRGTRNPTKNAALLKKKRAVAQAKEKPTAARRLKKGSLQAQQPISKEAAKLIAMAIRDMLHQR